MVSRKCPEVDFTGCLVNLSVDDSIFYRETCLLTAEFKGNLSVHRPARPSIRDMLVVVSRKCPEVDFTGCLVNLSVQSGFYRNTCLLRANLTGRLVC